MQFYINKKQTTLEADVYCENMTQNAPIAFYGWTSHSGEFEITPRYGFIMPGEFTYIKFKFMSNDYNEVSKGLYFVKALPLSDQLDLEEMQENIDDVFHENNIGILFTIATFSGAYDPSAFAEEVEYDYHIERENLKYNKDYIAKMQAEQRKMEDRKEVRMTTQNAVPTKKSDEDSDDDIIPESDKSKSIVRDSDLLGLHEDSAEKKPKSRFERAAQSSEEDDESHEVSDRKSM